MGVMAGWLGAGWLDVWFGGLLVLWFEVCWKKAKIENDLSQKLFRFNELKLMNVVVRCCQFVDF